MGKCLYCYKELKEGQVDYHPACAQKLYGTRQVPHLPYVRSEIGDLAKQVVRARTTLTGAQAKLSLDVRPGGKNEPDRFTIVGLWGRFILKPQTDIYRSLPELEDLTMHMAEAAKIAVVPHGLVRFADGELCYITRRIDRKADGSKIAMEDMCQLTERLTEYKYKGSYEQIAKAIKKYSAVPQLDLVNFWELVIFSWITGNSDMHLKNFSLYNVGLGYCLTPAYDLLSTVLVMPEDTEELALTLNGKKRKICRKDFESSIVASGVSGKVIENIAKKFRRSVIKWMDLIDNSFLAVTRAAENAKEAIRTLKDKLSDALENRSERNRWISHFTQFSTMETLDRKAVVHMIQSIKVIGKKELEITFTYQDE